MKIIIGSRGSKLALWQANYTKDKLTATGLDVTIKVIKTKGDQIQDLSFDKIEGKGFFTKEIEDALLNKEIDLAVHSCKDMPTESPDGLTIAAYSAREAPHDVLLISEDCPDEGLWLHLPPRAVVGTSSARRKAQLRSFRPDVELKDIRGNVGTRIQKLRDGEFDAIVLAAAGLDRLEKDNDLTEGLVRINLSPRMIVAAPAQGVLAFQIRTEDEAMVKAVRILNDDASAHIAKVERLVLAAFEGGCQMPVGVYAELQDDVLHMWVSKAEAWNVLPRRMHFRFDSNFSQPECDIILARFSKQLEGSVFISTDLGEDDIFRREIKGYGISLTAQSLIGFRAQDFKVDFDEFLSLNWLFFSSKNGVRFFFEKYPDLPDNVKIAAINKGTAASLTWLGRHPDFVGEGGSIESIAAEFDKTEGDNVLFPRASHSLRSIQKLLANKSVHDAIVYDNFPLENIEARTEDILVFTSPMNARNYFTNYSLKENQRTVAMGNSTAKAIREYISDCEVAFEPTKWALVDTVTRLLSSE